MNGLLVMIIILIEDEEGGEEDNLGGIMNILITGGMGYIGENLYRYLIGDNFNYDVDICDYGEVHSGDLPLADHLRSEDVQKYDGIVHLAALSGIKACEDNPEKAVRQNLHTAMNVFLEAARFDIPVVFTSTQAAKNPRSSSYAMMKRLCELMAEDLNNQGARITVLRLTNVYGGWKYLEKKQTVIKQFIKRFSENLLLDIDGDGTQKRDFLHVDDVCVFIERALNNPYTSSPIDIGTGIGTSINDIADMFNQTIPISGDPLPYPRRHNEKSRTVGVESSIADPSEAEQYWNCKAEPKMEEYISKQLHLIKGGVDDEWVGELV